MREDLRLAVRVWARRPGVGLLVMTTLAAGIAATLVVYALVDAVLWHPVPFANADRLVTPATYDATAHRTIRAVVPGVLEAWPANSAVFEAVCPYRLGAVLLTGGEGAQTVTGASVSHGLFLMLGARPRLGREFSDEEYSGGAPLVVLSDSLWRTRFGAAQDVLGRDILIDRTPHTVVGVMPPDFAFPVDSVRLWRPLSPAGAHASHFNAVGLLRAGVTFERAEEMTARTTRGLRDATGQPLPELRLLPLAPMSGRTRPVLLASIGAAALLLLIAVANVAQVLLGEALRREREMAVRSALGGSPTRLARQVIVEAGVLSVGAALLGLLLARAALPAFVSAVPWAISFFALRPIVIDARVLSCALVVTTLASVGAAAGPLWRLRDARTSFAPRTTGNTPGRGRLQGGLLVGQVALTTVLLMAAGLLGRSVIVLFERDIGFTPRPLLVVSVDLPGVLFPTAASRRALLDAWRQRVAGLPGVAAATVGEGSIPPSLGFRNGAIETADGGVFGDATTVVTEATVDDGYVATLGLPVLSGRAFDATDSAETQRVVMVSRALAERLWPAGDAVGRQVRLEPEESWSTVVGVVGNVRNGSQEQPLGDLALYWSRAQSPDPWRFQSLVLRVTDGSSRRLEPAVRQALRALNPDVPIADVQSGDDVVAEANVRLRFFTGLMSAIAIVALGLAIVGIYGSFLSAVRQQVGELGVRRVLGAEAPAIVRLVLGRAVRVALAGLTFGAPLAIATAGLLRGLLVELEPYDPATLASVALFLLAAALAAAFVPARFAGRIDPAVVLRHE